MIAFVLQLHYVDLLYSFLRNKSATNRSTKVRAYQRSFLSSFFLVLAAYLQLIHVTLLFFVILHYIATTYQ